MASLRNERASEQLSLFLGYSCHIYNRSICSNSYATLLNPSFLCFVFLPLVLPLMQNSFASPRSCRFHWLTLISYIPLS